MSPLAHNALEGAAQGQAIIFTLLTIYAALIGAVIGSFINVVVARLPAGESVVRPRSRCPHCDHLISWYDNIPILSYLLLRARCRHCEAPIAWHYPAVEALASVLAVALWLSRGASLALVFDSAVVALLLTLALIDARTYLLPERLTLPLVVIALVGRLASPYIDSSAGLSAALDGLLDGLAGAGLGVVLLGSVAFVGTRYARRVGRIGPDEDAMGFGDIVLIGGIGAQVGALAVLAVIFLASVQGSLIGGLALLRKRGDTEQNDDVAEPDDREDAEPDDDWQPPAQAIPFGPFLAMGAVEWILFGERLGSWLRATTGLF